MKLKESQLNAMDQANRSFVEHHCIRRTGWCLGGDIPKDVAAYNRKEDADNSAPCKYYSKDSGCSNPNHPKFKREWQKIWKKRLLRQK